MQITGRLPRREDGRIRIGVAVLATLLTVASVLVLGAAPSQAAAGWPQSFNKDGAADHTWDTKDKFNAACPESIAETPGSEPAAKQLADTQDANSFTPGGTVHYVFYDNPNFASTNFNLQDCVATYPAGKFTAADFDADGVLRNVSKSDLTTGATQIDAASLSGIVASDGEIFYSWTAPADVAPGSWVCNFARDVATGHGGSGNRKTYPVCYQVTQTVTPTAPTHSVKEACGVADTYTIPSKTGVVYQIGGVTKPSGTYDLGDGASVTITAVATTGYVLAPGEWTWTFTGSAVPACPDGVTPTAPTQTTSDDCGVSDTYTIPTTEGVVYKIGGNVVAAGTYDLPQGSSVTITAEDADAEDQLVIAAGATTSWTFTGGDVQACPTRVTPAAPTRNASTQCGVSDTYTIPSSGEVNPGVTYRVDGADKAAGTYALPAGTTVNITAVPQAGYVFAPAAVTSWSFTGAAVQSCGGGGTIPPPTTEAPTTTTTTEATTTTTTSVPELPFTPEAGEVEPTVVTQPPTTVPAELPFTGSANVGLLTLIGGTMLGLGALLVAAERRRRQSS